MSKTYFFMVGLPRSGNTLLSSILNQNPNLHVGANSPVAYLAYQLQNAIPTREEYINFPKPNFINKIIRSTFDDYYSDIESEYIIDRSGAWGNLANIEIIKKYITKDIKIICPVRNITEILTSFIVACNNNPNNFIDKRIGLVNNENRCEFLMKKGSMIDICLTSYYTSFLPGYENCFHFVDYDDLVSDIESEIRKLYSFLDIPLYDHSYQNIEQYSVNGQTYDDSIYGIDLHSLRSTIKKESTDPSIVLSQELIEKYSNMEFWK